MSLNKSCLINLETSLLQDLLASADPIISNTELVSSLENKINQINEVCILPRKYAIFTLSMNIIN